MATYQEIETSKEKSAAKRAQRLEERANAIALVIIETFEISDILNGLKTAGYKVHIEHQRILKNIWDGDSELESMSSIRGGDYQKDILACGGATMISLEKSGWTKTYISKCHPKDTYVRRIGVLTALRQVKDSRAWVS